jgi:hypothetical protein
LDGGNVLAALAKVGEAAHHGGVQRCQDGGFIKEAEGFFRVTGRGHGICSDAAGPPTFKAAIVMTTPPLEVSQGQHRQDDHEAPAFQPTLDQIGFRRGLPWF